MHTSIIFAVIQGYTKKKYSLLAHLLYSQNLVYGQSSSERHPKTKKYKKIEKVILLVLSRYIPIVDRNELINLTTFYLLVQFPLKHALYPEDGQSSNVEHCGPKIIKKWKMFTTIKCIFTLLSC